MNLKIAVHSDAGIKKKTNQDSVFIKTARTSRGPAALFAICDGMGGLAKGELASASLARGLDRWFMKDYAALLEKDARKERVQESICAFLDRMNGEILSYGRKHCVELGTTVVALLIRNDEYLIFNVGDSRAYLLADRLIQITKDQTFVQREVDAGRMSEQEAKSDARRSMLLQCVGASQAVAPDFYCGVLAPGTEFLLCSDGFRHEISEEEIYGALHAGGECRERDMQEKLCYLTELVKRRQETDNISSVLVQVGLEGNGACWK